MRRKSRTVPHLRRHSGTAGRLKCCSPLLCLLLSLCGCGNAPGTAPEQQARPGIEFLGEWSARGEGPGKLKTPCRFAVDANGLIYVTDPGQGMVHKFDAAGRPLLSFADARMTMPEEITIDSGGAIYVTDARRRSIFVFYPDGSRLQEIRPGASTFRRPLSVAVDDEGLLYVSEWDGERVHVLNASGKRLLTWGPRERPAAEKAAHAFRQVLGLQAAPDGTVLLGDYAHRRILRLTPQGELVAGYPIPHHPAAPMEAWSDFAVSPRHIFLLDEAGGGGIQAWTLEGEFVFAASLGGRLRRSEENIATLAWSPRGELVIYEPAGMRFLRFRVRFQERAE